MKTSSSRPILWVPTSYFAMGIPFTVLSLVSVIMFADMKIDPALITFWTSLLILPYSIKPLWSPLLEIYGTKRGFIIAMQAICGVAFGVIALLLQLPQSFALIIGVMGLIAVWGATNDIATDGLYISDLDADTQAKYIGWQGAFYNLAKVMANGAMVYLAGVLMGYFSTKTLGNAAPYAWGCIMALLAVITIILSIYHFYALPREKRSEAAPMRAREVMASTWEVFAAFFAKKYIWIYILFIICYRLTEGFAVKMVPIFLKADRGAGGLGLNNESVGMIYGTLGTLAFIIGSVLGGYAISRWGLRRMLLTLVAIFNIPFAVYFLLAYFQPTSLMVISGGIVGEYFCYGFGFVGLTLFMMQQVAPGKHSMAHYAFASGIMNLGFMIPGMLSGKIFNYLGFERFFLVAVCLSIPAFLMAIWIPFTHRSSNKQTTEYDLKESDALAESAAGV